MVVHVIHTDAPREVVHVEFSVKCSVKAKFDYCVDENSNGTETVLTQLCLTGRIICEMEVTEVSFLYLGALHANYALT